MSRGPLVLGDTGHALFRLSRARATSRSVGFDVKEVLYPGFEGRPCAESFDAFFESVEDQVEVYRLSHKRPVVVATGLGALVLLELRARGAVKDLPSIVLGAVPWRSAAERRPGSRASGEEERARFADPAFQGEFVQTHLHSPYDASELGAFFAGYATCDAIGQLHEWFDSGWTESVQGRLAIRPEGIDGIRVWACGADEVIDEDEHDAAVRALGARWPTERIEHWGHYPYLDAPGPWIGALGYAGV
ncbi:MAG: hypothetical protein AAFZ87_00845 [Planctomycetota bacterium]